MAISSSLVGSVNSSGTLTTHSTSCSTGLASIVEFVVLGLLCEREKKGSTRRSKTNDLRTFSGGWRLSRYNVKQQQQQQGRFFFFLLSQTSQLLFLHVDVPTKLELSWPGVSCSCTYSKCYHIIQLDHYQSSKLGRARVSFSLWGVEVGLVYFLLEKEALAAAIKS